MNKKIFTTFLAMVTVAALASGATYALFSGKAEQPSLNSASTDPINISITPVENWNSGWTLDHLKPCQTKYINLVVNNPTDTPLKVYSTLKDVSGNNGGVNEAECLAEDGTWASSTCTGNTPKSDLDNWINYDLSAKVPCPTTNPNCGDPAGSGWWQRIYDDADNVKVSAITGHNDFLGIIPANGQINVAQSYHLVCQTGNEYQDDSMDFRIAITAEQLEDETGKTSVTLENKQGAPDWQIITNDAYQATLSYVPQSANFEYNVTGTVKLASTEYSLIYYADPWSGNGTDNSTGRLIAKATSDDSGTLTISGSADTGSMPNVKDANYPIGAKIWLVPSSDYNETTHQLTAWNPQNYLFETGMVNYVKN